MNKYYFKDYVDTLVVALRAIEKAESPIRHIHPVMVREGDPTGPSPFSSREKRPPEDGRNSYSALYSISPITPPTRAIVSRDGKISPGCNRTQGSKRNDT